MAPSVPADIQQDAVATYKAVAPFTRTSLENVAALCSAVGYVVRNEIPGAIVECGVWKGGSMMAVAATLLRLGDTDRDLYLFDTFEGMPPPGSQDVYFTGEAASDLLRSEKAAERLRALAPLNDVQRNLVAVGYPVNRLHFVKGRVEETIPAQAPQEIALLRLDTDWYESTRHELVHLYPRLVRRGVLIVDDYGAWLGARQAVDEYLDENRLALLLNRIDESARIAVKP